MKRMRHYLLGLLLIVATPFLGLGQDDNYVFLPDASGFDRSGYEVELEATTQELIFVLPDAYQSQFKVLDFGFYLHNETESGGFEEAFDQGKALAAAESPFYLLFAKQTDQNGVYTKFWYHLVLPDDAGYPCVQEAGVESILSGVQVATDTKYNAQNNNPLTFHEAEINGILFLKDRLSKLYNCCESNPVQDDGRKKSTLCTNCSSDYLYQTSLLGARFAEYPDYKSEVIKNTDGTFQILITDDTGEVTDLMIALNEFVGEVSAEGFDTSITIHEIDLDGDICENENEILNFGGSILDVDYAEDIVLLKKNGNYKVFYRFGFSDELYGAPVYCSGFTADQKKNVILPAIVARWIIKRAIMAGTAVMIDISIQILVEKTFGNYATWGEAWENLDLKGWDLMITAIEGASGGKLDNLVSVISGCARAGINYVIDEDNCGFVMSEFFSITLLGCLEGIAGAIIGDQIGKIAKKYFPDKHTDLLGDAISGSPRLISTFFRKPNLLKSWKELFDFPTLRRKEGNLDILDDYLDEFPNVQTADIKLGIETASIGLNRQSGFYRYCINGLGCFVKDTKVLMGYKPLDLPNLGFMAVAAAMPLITPIQDVQIDDLVKSYIHSESYLTASSDIGGINMPGWQDYDYLEITPETWQVGKFLIQEENGIRVEINVNRPKAWFIREGITEIGQSTQLVLSELGVYGNATLLELSCTKMDTRDFNLNETGNVERPVITTYKRIVNEIFEYTFSDNQVLACTPNHPIYSLEKQSYIPIGDLDIGEVIVSYSDENVSLIKSEPRNSQEYVYNFEVWRSHNYFVSKDLNYNWLLVHNACWKTVDEVKKMSSAERKAFINKMWDDGISWDPTNTNHPIFGRGRFSESLMRKGKYKDHNFTGTGFNGDNASLGVDNYPSIDFYKGNVATSMKTSRGNNPWAWRNANNSNTGLEYNKKHLDDLISGMDQGPNLPGKFGNHADLQNVEKVDLDIFVREIDEELYPQTKWQEMVDDYLMTEGFNHLIGKIKVNLGKLEDFID